MIFSRAASPISPCTTAVPRLGDQVAQGLSGGAARSTRPRLLQVEGLPVRAATRPRGRSYLLIVVRARRNISSQGADFLQQSHDRRRLAATTDRHLPGCDVGVADMVGTSTRTPAAPFRELLLLDAPRALLPTSTMTRPTCLTGWVCGTQVGTAMTMSTVPIANLLSWSVRGLGRGLEGADELPHLEPGRGSKPLENVYEVLLREQPFVDTARRTCFPSSTSTLNITRTTVSVLP